MTSINVWSTEKRDKVAFEPLNPERVTMYVCGPTVYNFIHVGNARPAVVFDTFFRLLRVVYGAEHVCYARNITDVDDKINKAAKDEGIDIRAFTDRYIEAYHQDVSALHTLSPTVEPRATEHIEQMQDMIRTLVEKGHAYATDDGHVYFSVPSMKNYGCLSGRDLDDLVAGARVDVSEIKQHPGDFVLWKPSDADQPGWESDWGVGRPGWHIECSAMIKQHLGRTIDMHGGGQDLIFPHHENEIAQSECTHDGDTYCRHWMHNGYITIDNEKMSKSLGNFFTLREVLGQYPGELIRMCLLSTHYRKPLNWSDTLLSNSTSSLDSLYQALRLAEVSGEDKAFGKDVSSEEVDPEVLSALADDLNTPLALHHLHALASRVNKANGEEQKQLAACLRASAGLMGLLMHDPEAWLKGEHNPQSQSDLSEDAIEALLQARQQARKDRDFARADAIRDELSEAGVLIEDGPQGVRWSRK